MKSIWAYILLSGFVAGTAALCYWEFYGKTAAPATIAPANNPPPSVEAPKFPVPNVEAAKDETTPVNSEPGKAPVTTSASTFEGAIASLLGGDTFTNFFMPDELVRRIVVTVGNEQSSQLPIEHLPWKTLPGTIVNGSAADNPVLTPANGMRYNAYMALLDRVKPAALVAVYARFYPQFQKAYEHLGTKGYFNDRVVEAVDDLLAAPEPGGPLALERKNISYHFVDPAYEGLDAGQKLLVRIGLENEGRVKAYLRAVRGKLTALSRK